jgi:signal peptidase I
MPKRGDIIVFEFPMDQKRDFIKRVIGLPGDVFEVKAQNVYINGQLINEDYVIHQEPYRKDRALYPRDNYGPVVIPERALFMMGDNRENSQDSRYWSFLNMDLVKGRAFVIYWSWNSEDFNVRWNRISKLIK